jgi:hypothetical protein
VVLCLETKASCMLDKCCTTELHGVVFLTHTHVFLGPRRGAQGYTGADLSHICKE